MNRSSGRHLKKKLSSINTLQWSKSLLYRSITLKTLKNEIVEDGFGRKTILCSTEETFLIKKKDIYVIS